MLNKNVDLIEIKERNTIFWFNVFTFRIKEINELNNNDWNEYKLYKLIGLFKDQLDDIDRTTIFTETLLLDDLHWDPATLRSI